MTYPEEIYKDLAGKEITSPRERKIAERAYDVGHLAGVFYDETEEE